MKIVETAKYADPATEKQLQIAATADSGLWGAWGSFRGSFHL